MNTEKILADAMSTPASAHAPGENCLAVGTRLNDFEITGVLGEGGFGIVYLAFDHSLQRTVAIKEYMPGALAGRTSDASVVVRAERHKKTFDAGLKSFINEARLLAQFDHPSLVHVYRFWEENKTAYMVMRYYDGQTLKDIVNTRPEVVTEDWLKSIIKQILEALDTLYRAKILHRDISPDNIIVQKNGDAVLLDFGSARQIIGDMTQGITVILKPGYAPVEQYSDDCEMEQGPWTDIYALAAVIYFTIVKASPPISVARVVKDSLAPLQGLTESGFSQQFRMAVDRSLAIQPQDRPQSVEAFRRSLGIAELDTARNFQTGRSGIDDPADEVARIARIKNAPYTKVAQANFSHLDAAADTRNVQATKSRIGTPHKLAAALGVLLLAGLGTYLAMRPEQAIPPVPPSIPEPQPTVQAKADPVDPVTPPQAQSASASTPELSEEQIAWTTLENAPNVTPKALAAFLQQYPKGQFADAAQARLTDLNKAVTPASEEKVLRKVNIKLAIKPWGTVFVDGVQAGASPPLKQLNLSLGKHKIRVTNPGFPDFVTEVDVKKDAVGRIEYEFANK
ncbi:protein kinase [Undibacterium sp. Jales W-56]|uniref:serine/threonine-protein kinase n=1 Tax=Undibacterium sp. Jales W-56 TaxID=2897325 RepID=UPI0021D3ADFE|nr:serine/threonine-protein kinase [Undibacterium sp. Jales W-56]MCU6432794.1 protein kinase [Undibacterium sp. Jales W-56]